MKLEQYRAGFTLIELLVVITIIGILASGAMLLVGNVMSRGKFEATTKRMDDLRNAIIGNSTLVANNIRTDFGYVGDMGRLPANLGELVTQGAQAAWNSTTQCGWHGPYIRSPFTDDPNSYQRDAWGTNFSYNNTTGVITSLGSDGVAGGVDWAADINSSAINTLVTNNLTVKVYDERGNGATGATITVYYPNNGAQTSTSYVLLSGDIGVHTFNSIPTGIRRVDVVFSGETHTKWVAVVPNTTVTLEHSLVKSPTTPNPPINLTATPLSTTQIKLSWTAPTLNTDGTALLDLASYNIYRSIASGAETFIANTKNTDVYFTNTDLAEAQRYYYKIAAVNGGNNVSVQTAEVNARASSIQQNVGLAPDFGNNNRTWTLGIRNYSSSSIKITTMQLTWVASANPQNLDRIRINDGGGYTRIWGVSSASTPTDVMGVNSYDFDPGINYTLELRWEAATTLSSITIRINTFDGLIIVVN
jgi:prepilin-type N-terminal cleavage/methylation domain-containing protein